MQRYYSFMSAWGPVVGRILLGLIFVHSSLYKIPGTEMFSLQVGNSDAAGIPLPAVAVTLAFLLELFGGIALIVGWQTKLAASALIVFVILIALFFGRNFTDQMQMMVFFSCIQLIAALLYIAAFGPGRYSVDNKNK